MKYPITVLLVEDDQDDQFFFIEALREIDNAILYAVANNGKEAIDILRNLDTLPHLIFTDINMPVMDGVQCLAEIMKNPQTQNIPVVILSSDNSKAEEVCRLGAKAFLNKPKDCNTLRKSIEGMVNFYYAAAQPSAHPVLEPVLAV